MAEVPLLRVSRPVSACSRCRNAKVRCDGKLPACTACERAGKTSECSSANDQFAKGKERSYVASLELKIDRLEKALAQRSAKLDSKKLALPGGSLGASVQPQRQNDEVDVDDLVSDFGFLSVNATAGGCHGFMKEMSFARLVLATACNEDSHPDAAPPLPSRDLCRMLVQECFTKVFAFYPVLSETAVFGAMESVLQHDGRFCRAMDKWVVRMVLAIASMGRSLHRYDMYYREGVGHVAAALKHSEDVIQPGSLAAVQAVLLLVLYSMLDPSHFNCWYLVGVASRIMVDIGLHQESFAKDKNGKQKGELRRRVFYSVYSLDRAISMSYKRTFSFSDDSVDMELPHSLEPLTDQSLANQDHTRRPLQISLMKLRRALSMEYHALYGSSRDAFKNPWYKRADTVKNLKVITFEEFDNRDDGPKHVFRCEYFFGYMLLVSPPGGSPQDDGCGMRLLFECCVGFAQNAWLMCNHSGSLPYGTYLDMERAVLVGNALSEILASPSSRYIEGEIVDASQMKPVLDLFVTAEGGSRNVRTRAIDAMTQLDQVVDLLSARFGRSARQDAFQGVCLETLRSLHSKQALQASGRSADRL